MLRAPLTGAVLGDGDTEFLIAEWVQEAAPEDGSRCLIAPYHIHRECDEAWYVLEGSLCVQVGENVVQATAGDAVLVPKGTKHSYWNPDPVPVRYLLVMTNKTASLIDAIHSANDRSAEGMKRLFAKFDAEYLGW